MLEEILSYMLEALEIIEIPPEPPEQAGRSLYERLEIAGMRNQLVRRAMDLKKNIAGNHRFLDVLREMSSVVSETKMFLLNESVDLNTKRQVITEIYMLLKPGGILVIKTPNLDYLKLSINFKRLFSLLRGESPRIYIAHTNNNPDNEHHGLTNYKEMREELEGAFFHTPFFIPQYLMRKGISPKMSDLMFKSQIKSLNEHLIISTRKSIFVGVSDDL